MREANCCPLTFMMHELHLNALWWREKVFVGWKVFDPDLDMGYECRMTNSDGMKLVGKEVVNMHVFVHFECFVSMITMYGVFLMHLSGFCAQFGAACDIWMIRVTSMKICSGEHIS